MNKYQYVCENYKKPKPILFNTEMVRAILDGRKTQTRRPIDVDISNNFDIDKDESIYGYQCPETGDIYNLSEIINNIAPYQPGDILYVRETFSPNFFPDDSPVYKASCPKSEWSEIRWKPSIFMPKEVARIFLRVTNVRVEKLKNITDEDIQAEGLQSRGGFAGAWDELYLGNGFGWDKNPWVWVIEFERVRENDD